VSTISGSVHRSYDNFFRVASESVSGGPAISYQYDADGLLIAAGALQVQRDPATGFVTGSALGGTNRVAHLRRLRRGGQLHSELRRE
jgi:hypothetical protein